MEPFYRYTIGPAGLYFDQFSGYNQVSVSIWALSFQPEADPPLAEVGEIMYYTYVLKSSRNGKRYVGHTAKDPQIRLNEHNRGSNRFTKGNGPFAIVHIESYDSKTEARKRELFLKSGVGRQFLDKILNTGPLA
jgi:putative endonuclease